jgi:hypothetical protein
MAPTEVTKKVANATWKCTSKWSCIRWVYRDKSVREDKLKEDKIKVDKLKEDKLKEDDLKEETPTSKLRKELEAEAA